MPIGRLHILTDRFQQQRYSHVELAEMAVEGGADAIQFRQKDGTVRERLEQLREVAAVCAEAGVHLIVNDSLELALAVGADGVHLGQDDLPVAAARNVIDLQDGPTLLIGATCTTTEQARLAMTAGADYIGFGPVFATSSKPNAASVKGLDGLSEVCAAVPIPVVAIGGITADRIPPVLEAGAHGAAVMSAVTRAEDPLHAVRQIRAALGDAHVSS